MVSLWISDLLISASPYFPDENEKNEEGEEYELDESLESITAKIEHASILKKRDAELSKARRFFDDAKSRQQGATLSLEELHIDDDFEE
jgi:hypothetical protein